MVSNQGRGNATHISWEARLAAVGRVLDRRTQLARDVCLMETSDGFIVQRLVALDTTGGQRWIVATDELSNAQLGDGSGGTDQAAPRGLRRWRS